MDVPATGFVLCDVGREEEGGREQVGEACELGGSWRMRVRTVVRLGRLGRARGRFACAASEAHGQRTRLTSGANVWFVCLWPTNTRAPFSYRPSWPGGRVTTCAAITWIRGRAGCVLHLGQPKKTRNRLTAWVCASRWIFHVDQRQGDWFIGCMAGSPLPAANVSAKRLRSNAWFICEEGFAYGERPRRQSA